MSFLNLSLTAMKPAVWLSLPTILSITGIRYFLIPQWQSRLSTGLFIMPASLKLTPIASERKRPWRITTSYSGSAAKITGTWDKWELVDSSTNFCRPTQGDSHLQTERWSYPARSQDHHRCAETATALWYLGAFSITGYGPKTGNMNTNYELVVPDGFFYNDNISFIIDIFLVLLNLG